MSQIRSIAAFLLLMSSIASAQGVGADVAEMGKRIEEATTKPADSPEAKAVKDAAKLFTGTLYANDFEAVRAAFGGTKEDLEVMRKLHSAATAGRELVVAIDRKFPRAAGEPSFSGVMSADEMKAQIDDADVKITGDSAVIEQNLVLKKIDGKWKVVDLNPEDKPQVSVFVPVIIQASTEIKAGLEKGQYKSREEVEGAWSKAIEKGLEAAEGAQPKTEVGQKSTPATMPSTAPVAP